MEKNIIGFFGCPRFELIEKIKKEYKNAQFVDLDVNYNYPDLKIAPDNYCVIIKNILNNAFYLKDKIILILAAVGKDKCDSGFFVSKLLQKEGFSVIESVFEDICLDKKALKLPISKSNLPLKDKINLITKNIIERKDYSNLTQTKAKFGFWGVPPNDFSILDLFQEPTEVFGWLRAVEAGYPGDFELETYADESIPTIFFTQAFCSKTLLASALAKKYQGLFIDVDCESSNSIKAKIEAFIKLR